MSHWILWRSKKKKTPGFSLIELLVVVGIMGVLVAVAIPAYNGYRRGAKTGVIHASLTQIEKAFPTCLAVNTFMGCNTANVNGTLTAQSGATITKDGNDQRVCYFVTLDDDTEGYTGCLDFLNNNTGARNERRLGRPVGSPCNTPAISVSCSAQNATPTHDCPTNKGCVYDVGTTDCMAPAAPWIQNNNATCMGVTTDSQDVQCTGAGVCQTAP